jgi:hypothetical protein
MSDFDHLIFQASRFKSESALFAFRESGCILIRSVFNPVLMGQFARRAQRVFALRQTEYEAGTLPRGYHKNYDYGCMTYLSLRELDLPQELPFRIIDLFAKSLLLSFLRNYFESSVWWNQLESNMRRQQAKQPHLLIPFHQDGPFQKNGNFPQINIWMPLVACGLEAPSLEVAPIGLKNLWPVIQTEAEAESKYYAHYALNTESVLAGIGGPNKLWHPQLWPGDVLVMDPYLIHRTYATAEMSQPRYSIELRTLAADTLALGTREAFGMRNLG